MAAALEFKGKSGEALPIVTHRHAIFADVPLEVKTKFERAPSSRSTRNTEIAEQMMDAIHTFFGKEEVISSEALGVAFYKKHSRVLDRKELGIILKYLCHVGQLVRRTKGYYQLRPTDYEPEVRVFHSHKKGKHTGPRAAGKAPAHKK